jgi:hypothetical protein
MLRTHLAGKFVALAAGLLVAAAAFANGTVTSVKGSARVGNEPVTENQKIPPGSVVTTGPDAQVVMRFDDGQRVVLGQNTELKVVDYQFTEANPAADRMVFDLLKGGARFVTGLLGRRSQSAFQMRTPQATIGIRGTDFMAVIVNPLYLSVTQGAIAASTSAGTSAFGAGATASVVSSSALATAIPASALPAAASSAFSTLSTAAIGAAAGTTTLGTAAGAGTAAGTGVGAGLGVGVTAAIGAAAAAVAASSSSGTATSHTPATTHAP